MRRITAIYLILFANICLLAHAVIPHHHHDRVAVAVVDMMEMYACEHHSHDAAHSHDNPHSHYHHTHNNHDGHQHGNDSEYCLINDNLLMMFRGQESDAGYDGQDDVTPNLYGVVCESLTLRPTPEIPLRFYSYRANIPPGVDICSNGLRAPPFC